MRACHLRHVDGIALFAHFQQDTNTQINKQTNESASEASVQKKNMPKRYLLRRISFWNYDVVLVVVADYYYFICSHSRGYCELRYKWTNRFFSLLVWKIGSHIPFYRFLFAHAALTTLPLLSLPPPNWHVFWIKRLKMSAKAHKWAWVWTQKSILHAHGTPDVHKTE